MNVRNFYRMRFLRFRASDGRLPYPFFHFRAWHSGCLGKVEPRERRLFPLKKKPD